MTGPYGDKRLCESFSPAELEKTFFFSSSQNVALTPSPKAQRAWDEAKEICIECPVFLTCRASNLGQEYGVFGGLDEHERHLLRRQTARALARASADERAAMAAYFHTRYADGLGDSPVQMARATGYSKTAVTALIEEHQALLEQQAPKAPEVARWRRSAEAIVWPKASPPKKDGWVWYRDRAHGAHYVGETEDGEFLLMKAKPLTAQTTKWFPKSHVDLRSTPRREGRVWVGRPEGRADGLQGPSEDDQRAGVPAA